MLSPIVLILGILYLLGFEVGKILAWCAIILCGIECLYFGLKRVSELNSQEVYKMDFIH